MKRQWFVFIKEYAGREFLTDEEVAALDRKRTEDPGLEALRNLGTRGTTNSDFAS